MTAPKFKTGDKVKTADNRPGVVRQVNTGGNAALVDIGEGETFESSWFAVDSLTKGRASAKKDDAAGEDAADGQDSGE